MQAVRIHMVAGLLLAATPPAPAREGGAVVGWGASLRGGTVHDFAADLDGGGSFSASRHYAEAGASCLGSGWMAGLSAGYGRDEYRFSGRAATPWDGVENVRAGIFARWALDGSWTLFAAPSLRFSGEPGADFGDGWSAALFAGASCRIRDGLTLGPGVAVVGQIEDRPSYFPVLLIDWKITDRLTFATGGGFAATAGPGLSLNYALSRRWKAGLVGRYEKRRFRLDGDGIAPGGVGEDRNGTVAVSFGHYFSEKAHISAIMGLNFSGKISIEDSDGRNIEKNRYDPAPSVGLMASFRL